MSQNYSREQFQFLKQALVNADAVARVRGDKFGLCDCIDRKGSPYPSQWLADILAGIRSEGISDEVRAEHKETP